MADQARPRGNSVARTTPDRATNTGAVAIKHQLDTFRPVIARLLHGTGITVEAYTAQIANAMRAVPKLWAAEPESVLGAALKAAQLGLAPNDSRNLCWILPYESRGVVTAQFQMGYGGYMELARRAVPGLRFDGRAVYPNDEFDVDYGRDDPLTHRPAVVLGKDRGGDAYAWYVRARFPGGAVQLEVLDRADVEYHRGFSKQPQGKMWTDSYDAAALKSAVVQLKRWLPSSAQLVRAFDADEQVVGVQQLAGEADLEENPQAVLGEIEHTPEGDVNAGPPDEAA